MPQIRYLVGGVENVETIPDALVDYYQSRLGYTVVAARNAGVEAPTTLTADEKREAIVEATAPTGDELPATIVPADDGVPVITPDPEPATVPARTNKRRTAATDKES